VPRVIVVSSKNTPLIFFRKFAIASLSEIDFHMLKDFSDFPGMTSHIDQIGQGGIYRGGGRVLWQRSGS
jgi:hypothetical protein